MNEDIYRIIYRLKQIKYIYHKEKKVLTKFGKYYIFVLLRVRDSRNIDGKLRIKGDKVCKKKTTRKK